MDIVDLSRLQFAITALYHFLFVPLTLGLSWILVIMESVYVMTGKQIYKKMTQFWGKLFGINFALGVTTGITLEFQFGTNWAYYSHYVGDIFGVPLAIEGLMAFFLESTFVGLFVFGWDRLSRRQHLVVTMLMSLGTSFSALWILIANGWMQNPVGSYFNHETMRMETLDFIKIIFNAEAQNKFVHTASAGYVTGSMFVLSISSWYILKNKYVQFAKKSFRIGASFGLASVLSVIVLGDESGYSIGKAQQTKIAALEAMWETEPAPASFNIIAWPNEKEMKNDWSIRIPWVMGLIGTRSISMQLKGIKDIIEENKLRIISGREAVLALSAIKENKNNKKAFKVFENHKNDLGYGLLLKKYTSDLTKVTDDDINKAARGSVPKVTPMFFSFRIMVALGFFMLFIFIMATYFSVKGNFAEKKNWLKLFFYSLPLPWIALEFGWIVSEYGRQPWSIYGILPTQLSVSTLSISSLYGSIAGFIIFYTILMIVEMYLMIKFVRKGPI